MKEITRIHIAKIPYDIELPAKKELETYMSALERYAEDKEVLDDIEIRITELLEERGVRVGGVIAKNDVAAVRERLGEPSEFALEESPERMLSDDTDDSARKLYRDRDSAILGGVLAGIARFFRTEPLYVRLIFVVLLFGSAGAALIIYLVLWLVLPPARTAAEKLRMRGKLVTLESIKQFGEHDGAENLTAEAVRRTIRYAVGIVLLVGAAGALIVTVAIASGLIFDTHHSPSIATMRPISAGWLAMSLGLFVLAGLLLSMLGLILATAVLRRQWSKRMSVALVAIITAGLLSFGSGVGVIAYGHYDEVRHIQALVKETKKKLPSEFAGIERLVASAHTISSDNEYGYNELMIQYRVSADTPRYVLTALPDISPDIKIANGQARVVLKSSAAQQYAHGSVTPQLVIYGPALNELQVEQGVFEYIADYPSGQAALKVSSLAATQVTLSGAFDKLTVEGAGQVDMGVGVVAHLVARLESGSIVHAGVVRTLDVAQPDVCLAHNGYDEQNRLVVQAVSSEVLTYNGVKRAAETIKRDCGAVIVGSENDYDEWED